jgi:hypothetical protein
MRTDTPFIENAPHPAAAAIAVPPIAAGEKFLKITTRPSALYQQKESSSSAASSNISSRRNSTLLISLHGAPQRQKPHSIQQPKREPFSM